MHGLPPDHPQCVRAGDARPAGLTGEAWLNEDFTRVRLGQLLDAARAPGSHASALHIATHFNLRPGVMTQSWLLLGDGQRLRLQDMAGLDLGNVSLVTLSACETALGGQEDGREMDGLGAVLVHRGAGSVIASLWTVEDRSTAALMRSLYSQLGTPGMAPAQALQRAQHDVRAAAVARGPPEWRHPFYWAGFTAMARSDSTVGTAR